MEQCCGAIPCTLGGGLMIGRHTLRSRQLGVLAAGATLAALANGAGPIQGATADSGYDFLNPGQLASIPEKIPVQFVFVGYDDVNLDSFAGQLPSGADPVARYPNAYGVDAALGLHYSFDYSMTKASGSYDDRFFHYLSSQATPESHFDGQNITLYQHKYNRQDTNLVRIQDNYLIDGPSVENWLVNNPAAGIDPTRDTIYFINWW